MASYLEYLGVESRRIHIATSVDIGSRRGDHSRNRAISYYYVNIPKGCQVVNVEEGDQGAEIELSCDQGEVLREIIRWNRD